VLANVTQGTVRLVINLQMFVADAEGSKKRFHARPYQPRRMSAARKNVKNLNHVDDTNVL
jgi:hypothetical protein